MNFIFENPSTAVINDVNCILYEYKPLGPGYRGGGGRQKDYIKRKTKKIKYKNGRLGVDFGNRNYSEFAIVIKDGSEIIARSNMQITNNFDDISFRLEEEDGQIEFITNLAAGVLAVSEHRIQDQVNAELPDVELTIDDIYFDNGLIFIEGQLKEASITVSFRLKPSDIPVWEIDTEGAFFEFKNIRIRSSNVIYANLGLFIKKKVRKIIDEQVVNIFNGTLFSNHRNNLMKGTFLDDLSTTNDYRILNML